ncbi:MAG TPA: YbaN family protein [Anaerolineales bacterium]|nr:YbaN family protein [Anaerolineales bacterium]
MKQVTRFLLIAAGTLAVGLAALGIFLPILPTTPFLLLAAFLYARSSERFLRWLLTNRLFGAYIDNYRQGLGIPRREKILTITALWLTIGFSAFYVAEAIWLKILLGLIAVGVTVHLTRIPTYRPGPAPRPLVSTEPPIELEFDL